MVDVKVPFVLHTPRVNFEIIRVFQSIDEAHEADFGLYFTHWLEDRPVKGMENVKKVEVVTKHIEGKFGCMKVGIVPLLK